MRSLILSGFLMFSFLLNAQVSVTWGNYQKTPDFGGYILGEKNDVLISVVVEDGIPYLVNYSTEDVKAESFKELVLGSKVKLGSTPKNFTWETLKKRKDKKKNKGLNYEKTLLMKDKVVIIYYTKDKRLKTYFGQQFDFQGTPLTEAIQLERFEEKYWSSNHYFDVSQDSSMVYLFRQPKIDKNDKDKFILKIWGDKFEEQNNLEIELPYYNYNFSIRDFYLTSQKQLLLLSQIDMSRKNRVRGDESSIAKLMTLDVTKGELTEFDLKLKKRYIRSINLRFDEFENAYCVGTYGEEKTDDDIMGTFFYKLDYKTGEVSSENLEDFSKELIKEMNNSDSDKKRNQELRANINLKQIIAKPDGGSIVIFEEEYIQVVTTTNSNGGSSTSYYYHNNDLLIMNLEANGEIAWQAVIPKQQVSVNDGGMFNSFYATFYNNKVHFVFNDDMSNADSNEFKNAADVTKAHTLNPVLISMNMDGEYEKFSMLTYDKKRDFRMSFKNCKKASANRLVTYSFKAKKGCCTLGGRSGTSTSEYRVGKIEIQ
jgi:hypothetical protein